MKEADPIRICVFYSNFMDYNLATFGALSAEPGVSVDVFATSFSCDMSRKAEFRSLSLHNSGKSSFLELFRAVMKPRADVIFVSGWMDWRYLLLCFIARRKGLRVVCGFDTQYQFGIRHRIKDFLLSILTFYCFDFAFVPGSRQKRKAASIGFHADRIYLGALCCDSALFSSINPRFNSKRILYVGRLEPSKNLLSLVSSFISIVEHDPGLSDWRLTIVGDGSLRGCPELGHRLVEFLGGRDQTFIAGLAASSSFFCLPSRFEPWGVVIHEMACAGLPVLCSDRCGAGDFFVEDFKTGRIFRFDDPDEESGGLRAGLRWMLQCNAEELARMGVRSRSLGLSHGVDQWVGTFLDIARR